MTAQVANRIYINGSYRPLLSSPEQGFWQQLGSRPSFRRQSTDNWSGYISHWAVREEELYLTDIIGEVCRRDPQDGAESSSWCAVGHFGDCEGAKTVLSDICAVPFGGIPAVWDSGELRIPQGEVVEYVHAGWDSGYERDLVLKVAGGKIVSQKIIRVPAHTWNRAEILLERLLKLFHG